MSELEQETPIYDGVRAEQRFDPVAVASTEASLTPRILLPQLQDAGPPL